MNVLKFTFISDPGHGFLRVPLTILEKYGVQFKISPYSYKSKRYAFLEEDMDANTFMDAVKAKGDGVELKVSYIDVPSSCRNYPRFEETMGYIEYRKEKFGF